MEIIDLENRKLIKSKLVFLKNMNKFINLQIAYPKIYGGELNN